MKKIVFILLVGFLFISFVNAECDYDRFQRQSQIANNITYEKQYDENNQTYSITFYNVYDGVYISFYRNKKYLGIAFDKLPKDIMYYPTAEMGLCGSKIQIYNDVDFPDI